MPTSRPHSRRSHRPTTGERDRSHRRPADHLRLSRRPDRAAIRRPVVQRPGTLPRIVRCGLSRAPATPRVLQPPPTRRRWRLSLSARHHRQGSAREAAGDHSRQRHRTRGGRTLRRGTVEPTRQRPSAPHSSNSGQANKRATTERHGRYLSPAQHQRSSRSTHWSQPQPSQARHANRQPSSTRSTAARRALSRRSSTA